MSLRNNFVLNFKFFRKKAGFSQMTLAEICGTSPSYIGEIEIAKKFPSVEMIEKCCSAMGIDPYVLFVDPEKGTTAIEPRTALSDENKNLILAEVTNAVKKILAHI